MEVSISDQVKIKPMLIGCIAIYCSLIAGIIIAVPRHAGGLTFFSTYVALACGCIPLPTTQVVMDYALRHDPFPIAILGGVAYCISALIDYSIVTLAFRSEKVCKVKTTKLYRWLEWIFDKWPLGTLALDSFSVIPFEPIKLMACAKRYNKAKYLLACFIGRTVRYYLIGWVQRDIFRIPSKYLYGSIVVMLAIELVRRLIKRTRGRNPTDNKEDSTENPTQHIDNMISQYSEDMVA